MGRSSKYPTSFDPRRSSSCEVPAGRWRTSRRSLGISDATLATGSVLIAWHAPEPLIREC